MYRNSRSLENALRVLKSVLDGNMGFAEICESRAHIGKLVVAHSIMQFHHRDFLVPDTKRLLHHYSRELGFLVGDTPSPVSGQVLVTTSQMIGWHRPAEPMQDQPVRRVWLKTPPEVMDVLLEHPNTVAVTTQLLESARHRLKTCRAAAEHPAQLAERAAKIVQGIRQEGGSELTYAVYQALKAWHR